MGSTTHGTADGRGTAICVLGPGRTGTSLTARLLGLAGVHLGSDAELLSRAGIPANPKGFWEHRGLARINQRILRRLGGSWSEPPPLPAGWEESAELAGEREDARALVKEAFDGQPLWGWKDSRNSLTLPFWQRLLAEEDWRLRYVVCLRNPVDVVASLTPPRPLAKQEAMSLWTLYVASALVNTSGRPRLLLPYECYFRDWRTTVKRLLDFAGCPMPAPGSEAESRMREFTDLGLWRHRTPLEEVIGDPAVTAQARSLHLIAELLAMVEAEPALPAAVDVHARRLLEAGPAE